MKKILTCFVAVVIVALSIVPAFAADYPEPKSNFFVNDFGDCILDADEQTMQKLAEDLYNQTKAQVVCVTVNDLDGMDVRDYALNLGREWGIGEKNDNTGVLLLLSVSDRKVDIEVGYGLEGAITDGKTGRILDTYAIPYLKENDFSTGLRESFTVLVNETATELGVTVDGYTPIEEEEEENPLLPIAFLFGSAIFLIFVVYMLRKANGNNNTYNDDDDFGNNNHYGGPFIGGFGGGFGGSSGSSSGGFGGGGFSGGGGSFGGGGGSRGF